MPDEYVRELELSSRQFFSIPELQEKYIAWIMQQPMRHAQIKIRDEKAIPILTSFVDDVRARDKDVRRVVDLSNSRYAIPNEVVDRMIGERRVQLVEHGVTQQVNAEAAEIAEARWQ